MKYLIFTDKVNARGRSAEIATSLGCGKAPADVTKRWFRTIEHPSNLPQGALCVPTGEEGRLTLAEQLDLKDHAHMETNGWFPNATL